MFKAIIIAFAALSLAVVSHAADAGTSAATASAVDLLTTRQASTCACECVPVAKFNSAACSGKDSCKAYACKTADNAEGKTCCYISDTLEVSKIQDSDQAHTMADDNEPAETHTTRNSNNPDAKLSNSVARPWRIRCYYRVRCYCYRRCYYLFGRRYCRRYCRCYRLRYCYRYYSRY